MELILDDITYKSNKLDNKLNNVSYTFVNGITFVSGLNIDLLVNILFGIEKQNNGYIYLDERASKKDIYLIPSNLEKDNLYDELKYINTKFNLNYKDINERIVNSMKMANLDVKYLNEDYSILSTTILKKISLVVALFVNPKILIFDNYDKQMSNKDIEYFKKLVYKLNKMYNKNIIVSSNNIDNYLNIITNIVIFDNGKLVYQGTNKDLYDNKLYKYIDEPNIISFIKYLDKKGHKFDNYIDIKELLKAIYRDVENK